MQSILAIIVLNLVIQNIEYKNSGWLENRIPRCKLDGLFISTGWLISSVPSLIRYKISYTRRILVIMIFRDRNSNIFNDFKRFLEFKTWNYVLYGDFYEEKCVLACSENRESGPTALWSRMSE